MINLIFLHGGPGLKNYLGPFFQDLSQDFNLVFYDQLQGANVSIHDLIVQLDKIVNDLEGEKILVGHSWGSALAIEYAFLNQLKIKGLILMSSGLNFEHWKTDFYEEKRKRGLQDAPAEVIFLADKERDRWSGFLNDVEKTFSVETFDALSSYLGSHDLTKKFSSLELPILYLRGSEDVRFPKKVMTDIQTANTKTEIHEIVGAGHFPFLTSEDRKKVMKLFQEFKRKL